MVETFNLFKLFFIGIGVGYGDMYDAEPEYGELEPAPVVNAYLRFQPNDVYSVGAELSYESFAAPSQAPEATEDQLFRMTAALATLDYYASFSDKFRGQIGWGIGPSFWEARLDSSSSVPSVRELRAADGVAPQLMIRVGGIYDLNERFGLTFGFRMNTIRQGGFTANGNFRSTISLRAGGRYWLGER